MEDPTTSETHSEKPLQKNEEISPKTHSAPKTLQDEFIRLEDRIEKQIRKYSAAEITIFSFLTAILIGTGLLYLVENYHGKGLALLDALFMSTSAICVTGLTSVDFSRFTLAGQIITMILIQVGGFGVITAFRLLWIGRTSILSPNSTLTLGSVLDCSDLERRQTIFQILASTAKITITIELTGFLIMYWYLSGRIEDMSPAWFSLFHTISAFNNAGFGLYADNLMRFRDDLFLNGLLAGLIIMGGIGYPVILGIERIGLILLHKLLMFIEVFIERIVLRKPERISLVEPFYTFVDRLLLRSKNIQKELAGVATPLQMKVVIYGTITLLVTGAVFTLLAEWSNENTLGPLPLDQKILVSLFHSVTARTAGFNTVDLGFWHIRTLMFYIILMFVGAGPQGTAGGIKIPTFVTLLAYIRSSFRGRPRVNIFNFVVSKVSVGNAVKLYVMSSTFVVTAIILITLFEKQFSLMQMVFEVVSAFGTVGLSTGITFALTGMSKVVLIVTMFVGRVGLITIGSAIIKPSDEYEQARVTTDDGMKLQIG